LQGTVNFTVAASDACSGLVGAPVVTLTNGSTSETATYVSQSPAGVFNYTWTVAAATVLGTWTATVTAADTAGNVATLYPAFTLSVDTAQVSGQVELEGFVGTGTVPTHTRTVTFVATAGASVLKTWPLTLTNVSGAVFNYTLTQVPLTTTGISAKTDWNLRRKLAVTLVAGQGTANFTVANKLLGGDIDQTAPNFVTFADYLVLASYFGADVSTVPAAAQASISGVRFVNFVDYLVLSRNFGKIGDSQ
jgi:hypothetical protein